MVMLLSRRPLLCCPVLFRMYRELFERDTSYIIKLQLAAILQSRSR